MIVSCLQAIFLRFSPISAHCSSSPGCFARALEPLNCRLTLSTFFLCSFFFTFPLFLVVLHALLYPLFFFPEERFLRCWKTAYMSSHWLYFPGRARFPGKKAIFLPASRLRFNSCRCNTMTSERSRINEK